MAIESRLQPRGLGLAALATLLLASPRVGAGGSFLWIGGTNLNWGTAGNWQPRQVPGVDVPGADAVLLSSSGTVTNNGAGIITLNSLQASVPLSFINGVVSLQSGQATDLLLSSDVHVSVAGDLLLTGSSAFGWCTIDGSVFSPIVNQGSLTILSTANCSLNKPLDTSGSVSQNGDVLIGTDSFVHNGGAWTIAAPGADIGGSGTAYFDNGGTLVKSGAGTADILAYFFNDEGGSVAVTAGELRFRHEGTHGGAYSIANDAIITFQPIGSEPIHIASPAGVSGQGDLRIAGSFEIETGQTLTSTLSLASPNGLWINTASPLTLDGTLANQGKATWSTFTLAGEGKLQNTGLLLLPGGFSRTLAAWLVNASGGAVQQNGNLTLANGTVFNDPGATWLLVSGSILTQAGTTDNAVALDGTLTKTGTSASDTSFLSAPLLASGLLDVQGPGKLVLGAGGELSGANLHAASGATAVLDAGLWTVVGDAQCDGDGTVQLDAPSRLHTDGADFSNFLAGGAPNTGLRVTGGEITAANGGLLRNLGWMELEGAAIGTPSQPEGALGNVGHLLIELTSSVRGAILNDIGGIVDQSSTLQVIGGEVDNYGEWSLLGAADITNPAPGGGSLINHESGRLLKRADSILDSVVVPSFSNLGTVEVEGGTLSLQSVAQVIGNTLAGGSWIVHAGATLSLAGADIETIGPGTNIAIFGPTAHFEGLDLRTIEANATASFTGASGDSLPVPIQTNSGSIFIGGAVLLDLDDGSKGELDNGILGEIDEQLVIADGDGSGPTLKVATLRNAGTLRPGGAAIGEFALLGSLEQLPSGRVAIDLAGSARGSFDHLQISGAAALGGTFVLSLVDGFTPRPGDAFRVLDAQGPISGTMVVIPPAGFLASAHADRGGVTVTIDGIALPGDFDGDGVVGPTDLGLLLGGWGTTDPALDLSGDGVVGAADLAILLGSWS